MALILTKNWLIRFRRFSDYTMRPNERIIILVGDNEGGKSSILEAIDLITGKDIHGDGID